MLLGAFRGGNPLERIVAMSSKCCGEISPHKSASDHECVPPISGLGVITLDENRAYISKAAEGNRDSQTTGTREGIPLFGIAIRRQVVYRCAIRYPIGIRLSSVRGPTVATQLRMGESARCSGALRYYVYRYSSSAWSLISPATRTLPAPQSIAPSIVTTS